MTPRITLFYLIAAIGGFAGASALAQSPTSTGAQNLQIKFDLDDGAAPATIDFKTIFRVIITNTGKEPLRIYGPYQRPERVQWTLQFISSDPAQSKISKQRSVPANTSSSAAQSEDGAGKIFTIAPGKSFYQNVLLSSCSYDEESDQLFWTNLPSPNAPGEWKLSVILESPATENAEKEKLWTGKIESPEVAVRFQSPNLKTPTELLWSGFAEAALEQLKRDPKTVNSVDRADRCTPLHHAARFRHLEVVEWLVANGAKVNAVAYNDFTPLYFADRPEIVKAILKGKPNIDGTQLEHAATKFADARTDEMRKNWREIASLFRAAGAKETLRAAVYFDDREAVKRILAERPSEIRSKGYDSPLRIAAKYGRLEICKALLEVPKIDVDEFGPGSGYPVIKGALKFPAIVRLLIEHKADLKKRITWQGGRSGVWLIKDDATLLHHAAADGVPETIQLLIDHGVDIFATAHNEWDDPEETQTALEVAAMFGRGDNALAIIEHPKFKAAPNVVRWEALNDCLISLSGSAARSEGDLRKWFTTLAAAGADVRRRGREAIQYAAGVMHPTNEKENQRCREAIKILRELGAEIDLPSAVVYGDEQWVAELLAKNPKSANEFGLRGLSALHLAVGMDSLKIVELLLDSGGDIEIGNQSEGTGTKGETALATAAFWERLEIAKLLIKRGANVNAVDSEGWTPLFNAARMKNLEIIRLLLENGAKIDIKDEDGKSPLDWAGGDKQVADLFDEFNSQRSAAPKR